MNPKNPNGAKAGAHGQHAEPMTPTARFEAYTRQNGHNRLTPRQRRRLNKKEGAAMASDARKAEAQ